MMNTMEIYKAFSMLQDVRTDDEWQAGHIEGAVHKPISDRLQNGIDLEKKLHITAVCGRKASW
jgi:hydroxyacylglutathione hydrolase